MKQRSVTLVPLVEVRRVTALDRVHAFRQIGFGSFEKDVEVICHEDFGEDSPMAANRGASEEAIPLLAIGVVPDDVGAIDAAIGDVIHAAGHFNSQTSGHGRVLGISA